MVGGGIVKVPQIIKIMRSKSASGLSFTSYVLDTASLAITVAYNVRNGFPFSTYGENGFLLIQNVVILLLIIGFSTSSKPALTTPSGTKITPIPTRNKTPLLAFTAISIAASLYLLLSPILPMSALTLLLTSTLPLTLSSKFPQIIQNYTNGSTGQLSAFLVFNSTAGCLARLFTTQTETGDQVLWWGFFLAAILNAVIAVQMMVYWNRTGELEKQKEFERLREKDRELIASPQVTVNGFQQSGVGGGATQAGSGQALAAAVLGQQGTRPKSPSSPRAGAAHGRTGSGKWTRKVD